MCFCANFARCKEDCSAMEERTTFFRTAAAWGLPFGFYLSGMSVAWIYADRVPSLSIVALAMLLLLPVVVYWLMRRYDGRQPDPSTFSGLWMLGMLLFICASLVTALVTYCVFRFLRPGFFYEQAQFVVSTYSQSADSEAREAAVTLQRIVDGNLLPRVIELVFFVFCIVSFLGSMLSACLAWMVSVAPRKPKSPRHDF